MPNPNEFTGMPWGSQYFTRRMRRINALEKDNWRWVEDWTFVFTAIRGISIYEGEIYLANNVNAMMVYDFAGDLQRSWTGYPLAWDVSVYDDEIYVLCQQGSPQPQPITNSNWKIMVFDLVGNLDRQWNVEDDPDPSYGDVGARRLVVGAAGVFVTVTNAPSMGGIIQAFDHDGNWSWTAGEMGSGDGEFADGTVYTYDIVVDGSYLWIGDPGNGRIQKWDTAGNFVSSFGSEGSGEGEFYSYLHLAFEDSLLYAASITSEIPNNGRAQVFNGTTFQREFGAHGEDDGGIASARDIAVSGDLAFVVYSGGDKISVWTRAQTEFYRYTGAPQSLGTPDGGVDVPALEALVGYRHAPRIYKDMRDAIERLAWSGAFRNVITGNKFNWTISSADNLYYVAMGDRSDFGATGGAQYDWTRTRSAMNADLPRDIDLGELDRCIQTLEAS
ncbi:MAG: hypothetical protein IT365_05225 [Candidatus Hydrogenedentes bacterium]|nr:hypothetical protein [Candidatus Hydrogenedentota bacterium]